MNKDTMRKQMINLRKNISNKKELSTIIVNKVLKLDIFKNSRVIALYSSMDTEVNTSFLINKCLNNKKVLLPKITNDTMIFIEINKNTVYSKSKIGVMEPIGDEYLGSIDLIIVPGIAFDTSLNRLGFGKGYYDKYLSNKNIFKIGLCFDNQITNSLPINDFDISMDMVITDKRVIFYK